MTKLRLRLSVLLHNQPLTRHFPFQNFTACFDQSAFDLWLASFSAQKRNATTAPGAADFGCFRAVSQSLLNQTIHMRRRDPWRQTFPVWIGSPDCLRDGNPIVGQRRRAHLHGGVPNPLKDRKHFLIAIDVTLKPFPIINSRMARFPGVADHKAVLNFALVDRQMFTIDAIGIEMNAGGRSIEGGIVVLQSSRHFDDGRFNVRRNADELSLLIAIARQLIEGADPEMPAPAGASLCATR